MPTRTTKRTAQRTQVAEASAEGFAARLFERAIENPAMTGGLLVMAMTAAAIVSNALLLQSGHHPDPLFVTRPAAAAISQVVPIPRPRIAPPVDQPPVDVAPTPAPMSPAPAPTMPDVKVVAQIQRALTGKDLYHGAIDGVMGSRTRAAISAYEKSQGMAVTGEPSPALLDRLNRRPVVPVAAAKPAPKPVTPTPVAKPAPTVAPAPAADATQVTPLPVVKVAVKPPVAGPANLDGERYRKVARALNRIGYGPLPEDGNASEAMGDAIRRFELDNGLPITGKAGDRVINRLAAIGAITTD